jgi:hypothetical protein
MSVKHEWSCTSTSPYAFMTSTGKTSTYIAIDCENHIKYMNTLRGQNAELRMLRDVVHALAAVSKGLKIPLPSLAWEGPGAVPSFHLCVRSLTRVVQTRARIPLSLVALTAPLNTNLIETTSGHNCEHYCINQHPDILVLIFPPSQRRSTHSYTSMF